MSGKLEERSNEEEDALQRSSKTINLVFTKLLSKF
jgi:hypothetical protein